jgi:hypothetical protein
MKIEIDTENESNMEEMETQISAVDKLKAKSSKRGSYPCEYCDKKFPRKDRLDRHTYTHTKLVRQSFDLINFHINNFP